MKNKNTNLQNKSVDISNIKIEKSAKIKKNSLEENIVDVNIIENRDDKVITKEKKAKEQEKIKYNEYEAYLRSIKEICNLALKNGDLRSALSAKKLEADWIKQNKCSKEKFGINSMSDEELENLIKELENGFHEL